MAWMVLHLQKKYNFLIGTPYPRKFYGVSKKLWKQVSYLEAKRQDLQDKHHNQIGWKAKHHQNKKVLCQIIQYSIWFKILSQLFFNNLDLEKTSTTETILFGYSFGLALSVN